MGALWYTINMKTEDAAYVAGIIDADGCIAFHRKTISAHAHKKRYQSWEYSVIVSTTNKDFLNNLKDLVNQGKGQVGNCQRNLIGKARPAYRIKWSGSSCIALLKEIRSYLRLKIKQADIILNFKRQQIKAQNQRSGQGHRYPDWLHNLAASIEKNMRQLNKRGIDK